MKMRKLTMWGLAGLMLLAGDLLAVETSVSGSGAIETSESGTSLTLTATPSETGIVFVGWKVISTSGNSGSTENPLTLEASDVTSVTAYFLPEALATALKERTTTDEAVQTVVTKRIESEGLATKETQLEKILADKSAYKAYERSDLKDVTFSVPKLSLVNGQPQLGVALRTKGEGDSSWTEVPVKQSSASGGTLNLSIDAGETPFFRFVTPN